jgi:hypothetical protein
MRMLRRALGMFGLVCSACGDPSAPSPFERARDAGAEEPGSSDAQLDSTASEGAAGAPANLGGPCLADEQCNDTIDCTFDTCDPTLGRCRFEPDHASCADGIYCNGVELCDSRLGCVSGEPIACSDGNPCTVDSCVEADGSCAHVLRDADGDQDPDWACRTGGDCNDTDPRVSSLAAEVCSNGQDDDCDGETDEADCELPEHDTCADPLAIEQSATHSLSFAAAGGDYAASCAGTADDWQDVVVAVVVEQEPVDVDVVVTSEAGRLALAAATLCGDASTELGCSEGIEPPGGGRLARLRLRQLQPGSYPVYVFARSTPSATLTVRYLPATSPPTNETCGTALQLEPELHTEVSLGDAQPDVVSACEPQTGELLYSFSIDAPQDVRVFATSLDGFGEPLLSLRAPSCSEPADELSCRVAQPAELYMRALPAATYYVAVAATGPTDVDLLLLLEPPSEPPADENCDGAPLLEANATVDVPLARHVDDVFVQCLPGAADAAYTLELERSSDVRLLQRISSGDTGGLSLVRPPCSDAAEPLACTVSSRSPVRTAVQGLEAGSYHVVVESADGNPAQLTALVRPATPPVLVAFADSCEQAVEVGPAGGLFQGNTANASADYAAGCDSGGSEAQTAPEQMLRFSLSEPRRVVLDMQGSGYRTLLAVRRGPDCPGDEVVNGCAAGYVEERSFLDLVLDPGDYFIQVDGYSGDAGPWLLDVYVVQP